VWVREAAGAKDAAFEAVERVMTLRFGEKRVTYDPSDPEANNIAVSKGYTVVPGAALTAGEWQNAKSAGSILPAGRVTPSPKPFSPDGSPLKMLEHLTPDHERFIAYVDRLHRILIGTGCVTQLTDDRGWKFSAAYGRGGMTFAGSAKGDLTVSTVDKPKDWFKLGPSAWWELLLHEFAHSFSSNHLSSEYHDALCALGAKLTKAALDNPKFVSAGVVAEKSPAQRAQPTLAGDTLRGNPCDLSTGTTFEDQLP
ncbi:MAG: hypothetical protein MUF54_01470, partial [Polyangiaceae bacterium]|nr:hypothetical protein [Polyangiaceae bacterium]